MKKVSAILISILLIFQIGAFVSVSAADSSISVISAYYKDGKVYSFLNFDKKPQLSSARYNIIKDNIISENDRTPKKIVDTDCTTNYIFLIDTSTSMPAYKSQITALANSLLNNEKNKINVSIATFGEKFTLVKTGLSNIKRITAIVDSLDYNENATDICGGLSEAFDFVSSHEMTAGELCEIILITDGIPYLNDGGNNQNALASASKTLKDKIKNTPEVIVNSVCFREWESYTYSAVSAGTGLHERVTSELSASQAGEKIAEFTDSLYELDLADVINPYAGRDDVDIICLNTHEIVSIKNLRNFDQRDFKFKTIDPGLIDKPENPSEATTVAETTESTTETLEPTSSAVTTVAQTAASSVTSITATADEAEQSGGNMLLIILIIAATVIAAAVITAAILIKKKNVHRNADNKKDATISVIMTAQIIEGNCLSDSLNFNLEREIIIGTDNDCDLAFDDAYMAPKNTRIFISDGVVYIEDLNSKSNTYLEGMKIYEINRLRSGNEISIGNTRFRMLF